MDKLEHLEELFAGRHFDREVILLCIRWYLRFKLSLRELVEMMAERGLSLAHTTTMRWVRRYTPEFENAAGCWKTGPGDKMARRFRVHSPPSPRGRSPLASTTQRMLSLSETSIST
jgi:hypothetical protein